MSLPLKECAGESVAALRRAAVPLYGAAILGYAASLTIQGLAAAGRSPAQLSTSAVFALFMVELLLSLISEAAIVDMAGRSLLGEQAKLSESYVRAAFRLPAYAITAVMAGFLSAFGLVLLVIPGLLAIGVFAFWRQAVVQGGLSGSGALAHSVVLARPHMWRLLGLITLISIGRLAFIEPAIMAAQSANSAPTTAFLTRYATRIDMVIFAALLWRLVVDPFVLALFTALYLKLAGVTVAAAAAGAETLEGDQGEMSQERDPDA